MAQKGYPSPVERALEITAGIGTRECLPFRQKYFSLFEPICLTLASGYARIAKESGHVEANRRLLKLEENLIIQDLNLTWDDQRLKEFTEQIASEATRARASQPETEALGTGRRLAAKYGIEPPAPADYHDLISPVLERLCDYQWWLRQISRLRKQKIESIARDLRTVHQEANPYISGWGLNNRRREKTISDHYLSTTYISNQNGEQYSLKEISDRNISNPALRRAELMTRVKGFDPAHR